METQLAEGRGYRLDPEAITWEEDHRTRVGPALLTSLFHEAVPVTRYVGWRVTRTAEGFAESVLPLQAPSTNQYATHQAALMALAADYTGGIALATLLRGVPVIGFHPQPTNNGAAIWLVRAQIDYKIPSAADLVVSAAIPPESAARIRDAYASGAQFIEEVDISFVADGEAVATAKLAYVLRQSKYLKPQTSSARPGVLFRHRSKASARLIAGVRAAASAAGLSDPDPYSAVAAGVHGRLLAERFTRVLPQLPGMVAARTRHVDEQLLHALSRGARQIVLVGAGLDFRCSRIANGGAALEYPLRVFELDFPHMLDERERILSRLADAPRLERVPLATNLELDDVHDVLSAGGYDPDAPSFIVFEGTSMYLDEDSNRRTLASLARLARHPESRIWVDVVSKSAIERTTNMPEADAFLTGMEQLGEPFIFGIADPPGFFATCGLSVRAIVPSSLYQATPSHPIFGFYHFCSLAAQP